MKLIKGQTLEELLKTGAPVNHLAVMEAVAQAVGYAHAHDVVHRELKPGKSMRQQMLFRFTFHFMIHSTFVSRFISLSFHDSFQGGVHHEMKRN
jgi:hypothetical protein